MGKHDYMKYDGCSKEPPSPCTSELHCSSFHLWLRDQDQWIIDVAQNDDVYKAMKMSYDANRR